ncbi:MAG TPA: hypothetical protein EYP04_12385 [Anaerolineae bacterium]|nr:hypothetical protein [Anaerolineae bacterium]HIQ06195.1 hypothetical protein [Anaerolineae bacterium]
MLRTVLRRVWGNLGSIVLSLLLAVIVWVVAVEQEDPVVNRDFPTPISVTRVGPDEGIIPFGTLLPTVRVRVRGPRSAVELLRTNNFTAIMDLRGLPPGTHDVPVRVSCSDPRVKVVEVQPAQIRVLLDRKEQKRFPVRVEILDSPAVGYFIPSDPVVVPAEVEVSGPARLVDQVAEVVVSISVQEATSTVSRLRPVVVRDAQDIPVSGVRVKPVSVQVTVTVQQRPGFAAVTVLPRRQGQPAPGYRVSGVTVEPSIVTVFGSSKAIEKIPGYVETTPVDIEGASADVTAKAALLLPENVSSLGVQTVTVRISITAIESGLTIQRQPTIQGLGPGLTATKSISEVDVILAGPLPKIEAIESDPDSVAVILDLSGLSAGDHSVTPLVQPPEGVRVEGVLPETVNVRIEPVATPTSVPTLTPTVPVTATQPTGTVTVTVPSVATAVPTTSEPAGEE